MVLSRPRILCLFLYIVCFLSFIEYLARAEPDSNIPQPRFALLENSPFPDGRFKAYVFDTLAAQTYMEQLNSQVLHTVKLHIVTHRVSERIHGLTWPPHGITLYLPNHGIPDEHHSLFLMYHELWHYAFMTQEWPDRWLSLLWRRTFELLLVPIIFVFMVQPRLSRWATKVQQPLPLRIVTQSIVFIGMLITAHSWCLEELAGYEYALRSIRNGAPPLIGLADKHGPVLDSFGDLAITRQSGQLYEGFEQFPACMLIHYCVAETLYCILIFGTLLWFILLLSAKTRSQHTALLWVVTCLWCAGIGYNYRWHLNDAAMSILRQLHYQESPRAFSWQWLGISRPPYPFPPPIQ